MNALLDRRSPSRQRLVLHLHRCGPRPVLEALLALEAGQPLDDILEDFGRIPPHVYQAVGADHLALKYLFSVEGGRRAS